MSELKNKIEALLFSAARKMDVEEIARLCRTKPEDVIEKLTELKFDYEQKDSSIMVVDEGKAWKLTVKEKFIPLVQKIVTETELNKSVLETLAVIAWKYPILQSDLIKIRTNKAYEHLKELEDNGYITRQKHGRTNLIKLTQKFFDYFDLPKEKLKEQFKDFEGIAKAIEQKEKEIEKIKQEEKKKEEAKEDVKGQITQQQPEIDLIDEQGHKEKLKIYDIPDKQEFEEQPIVKVEVIEDKKKLGNLEVVDETIDSLKEEERKEYKKSMELEKEKLNNQDVLKKEKEGIKLTQEMEKVVDKKVEEILHPEK
jgi:segregation and condensation protein B